MDRDQQKVSAGGAMMVMLLLLTILALEEAYVSDAMWYSVLDITVPLLLLLGVLSRRKKSEPSSVAPD